MKLNNNESHTSRNVIDKMNDGLEDFIEGLQ